MNNEGMNNIPASNGATAVPYSPAITVQIDENGKYVTTEEKFCSVENDYNPPVTEGKVEVARKNSVLVSGSSIDENCIVNIGGMEVSVKAAMAAGLLRQDSDGSYLEVKEAPKEPVKQEHQEEQESLDKDTEDIIDSLLDNVQPGEVSRAVRLIASGEKIDSATLGRAASQMGIEPEAMSGMLGGVRTAFESQALEAVATTGLNPQEVFDWAYREKPKEMANAIKQHTSTRNTSGYKELAKEYVSVMDQYHPEQIVAALPKEMKPQIIMENGKPKVILNTPAGQITWQTANRMGFIKGVSWHGKG